MGTNLILERVQFTERLQDACDNPTREAFAQLHHDLNLIEYTALVDRSAWAPSIPKPITIEPICSVNGCNNTTRGQGGLFLINDKWLCPTHLPPLSYNEKQPDGSTITKQRSPPVGYPPSKM